MANKDDDPTNIPTNIKLSTEQISEAIKKATKSAEQALQDLSQKYSEAVQKAEEYNQALKNGNKIFEQGREIQYTTSELKVKQIEQALEIYEINKNILKTQYETQQQNIKNKNLAKEEEIRQLNILKEQYEAKLKVEEKQKKENETLKYKNKLAIDFGKSQANTFSSLTGIGTTSNTILGRMIQLKGEGVSFTHSIKEAKEQIFKMTTPANIVAAIFSKLIENTIALAKEQDKAFADFEKEAGNVKKYEDSIMNLRRSNGLYGISVTDASKQFAQFKVQFAGFDSMSLRQRETLATTAAQLNKLGIATEDVVKTQELLIKGMGMSVTESTNLQKSLYATAQAMGLPPKQVAADFAKAAPQLSAHGKNMTKVFLDLQNNAKNTGIEFNRLLAITSKFDTFEGAADSAGQLNAILGGDYLNSIELLNATEGERVKIMQESLKASGRSIEAMSKQEQMAMVQALGLQDVSELQKLMNNETTKGTVETIRAQKAQEEMNKTIEDAQELGEMLKNLMNKFAISLRPVIELLKSATAALLSFFDNIGEGWDIFKQFIGGFEILGKMSDSIKAFFSGVNDLLGGLPAKFLAVVGSIAVLYGAWKLIKFGITSLIKGVAKIFAETLETMSGPVANAAKNLGKGVGEGFNAASKGISSGLKRLGSAFSPKNMIGIALGVLALYGIAQSLLIIIKSLQMFADITWESIAKAGIVLLGLVLAITALGAIVGNPVTAALLAAGVLAIMGIGVAVMMLGIGIKSLGDGLININTGFKGLIETLKSISDIEDKMGIMLDFIEELSDINVEPINELAKSITSLANSMKLMSELNIKMPNINQTVSTVSKALFIETQQTPTPVPSTVSPATSAAISTNTTQPSNVSNNSTNIVPVAVYLDSKKIGEILDPKIKQTIQDSLKQIGSKTVAVGF